MAVVTSRADFERLIDLRLTEAKLLMDQIQDWDGAYYLAGYAVQYALKVRIISKVMQPDTFPSKKLAEDFYKHDLTILLRSAGLYDELNQDPRLKELWRQVSRWNEQGRYEVGKVEQVARELYKAIESEVLPWIKARW